jgi:hypothetical protein
MANAGLSGFALGGSLCSCVLCLLAMRFALRAALQDRQDSRAIPPIVSHTTPMLLRLG